MFPSGVAEKYYEAQQLFVHGEAADALAILDRIAKSAPNHPEIMYAKALCLQGLGRNEEGLALCNKLYSMHSDKRGVRLRDHWYDTPPEMPDIPQAASETNASSTVALTPEPDMEPEVATEDEIQQQLETPEEMNVDPDFFEHCAIIVVDVQAGGKGPDISENDVPPEWKELRAQIPDLNKAAAYTWDVAVPTAIRVVKNAHKLNIPAIYLHWGFQFKDGRDLEPEVYNKMKQQYGPDPSLWMGHPDHPNAKPHPGFDIRDTDYVLPKTTYNAFRSTTINFLLKNLGVKNIIFVGGFTEQALGQTAIAAKRRGYRTMCIDDATFNVLQSTRRRGHRDTEFDYLLTFAQFMDVAKGIVAGSAG